MKVLQIVLNDFSADARVLRMAALGAEMGGEVRVFALDGAGLRREETIGAVSVCRFPLRSRSWSRAGPVQALKYLEAFSRMLWAGRTFWPDLVHANDLTALPIGAAIARACDARLVYDAHELWSDPSYADNYMHGLFRAGLFLERILARRSDAVVTVSGGLASEMARNLGIDAPTVVRNLPARAGLPLSANGAGPLRECLAIASPRPIVLYQGLVRGGRGIETLLDSMSHVKDPTAVLVVLGDGPQLGELKRRSRERGLEARVRFHPAVSPAALPAYTRDGTIGVCPTEALNRSYYFSLPNKFFEYIQAGLPVVASDLPETRRIVETYGVGTCFHERDPESLARRLDEMLSDPAARARHARASSRAAAELCWEVEKHTMRRLYEALLSRQEP